MAKQLYTNNFLTELTSDILLSDTVITVVDATKLPIIIGTDFTLITLINGTDIEILKVTGITGAVLTIERAQEGTTAKAFTALATKVFGAVTRGTLDKFEQGLIDLATTQGDVGSLQTDVTALQNAGGSQPTFGIVTPVNNEFTIQIGAFGYVQLTATAAANTINFTYPDISTPLQVYELFVRIEFDYQYSLPTLKIDGTPMEARTVSTLGETIDPYNTDTYVLLQLLSARHSVGSVGVKSSAVYRRIDG